DRSRSDHARDGRLGFPRGEEPGRGASAHPRHRAVSVARGRRPGDRGARELRVEIERYRPGDRTTVAPTALIRSRSRRDGDEVQDDHAAGRRIYLVDDAVPLIHVKAQRRLVGPGLLRTLAELRGRQGDALQALADGRAHGRPTTDEPAFGLLREPQRVLGSWGRGHGVAQYRSARDRRHEVSPAPCFEKFDGATATPALRASQST